MTSFPSKDRRLPDRREFIALGIGAFVVAAVPVAARRRTALVRRTLPVMGTIAEVSIVHRDEAFAERAVDAAMAELSRVEQVLTRFNGTSEIGRANRLAAADGVVISPETAGVLRDALAWAEASDGIFDPAVGRVSELWDVLHRHEPPPPRAVQRLAGLRLYRHVDISTLGGRPAVRFTSDEVHLDLGSIGKGYGIDRAVGVLRDWGITSALVNVGGDLYAIGRRQDGEPWRVGIRDPNAPERLLGELPASDEAIATSGDYERFFRYRGLRYHHLMDPFTAAPRRTPEHSVTVRADRSMHADAAATTVYGAAPAEGQRLLDRHVPGARIVSTA